MYFTLLVRKREGKGKQKAKETYGRPSFSLAKDKRQFRYKVGKTSNPDFIESHRWNKDGDRKRQIQRLSNPDSAQISNSSSLGHRFQGRTQYVLFCSCLLLLFPDSSFLLPPCPSLVILIQLCKALGSTKRRLVPPGDNENALRKMTPFRMQNAKRKATDAHLSIWPRLYSESFHCEIRSPTHGCWCTPVISVKNAYVLFKKMSKIN